MMAASSRDRHRQRVLDEATRLGLTVEALPGGLFHVCGPGISVKCTDVANLALAELRPARVGKNGGR